MTDPLVRRVDRNGVAVIDLASRKVVKLVGTGRGPDGVAVASRPQGLGS